MSLLIQLKSWLATPVVETADYDGTFRVRRLSLWLMIAGWVTFFASCMIGLYLSRYGMLAGYHELAALLSGELVDSRFGSVSLQTIQKITELSGAALFSGGMISVSLFDKFDRVVRRRGS